MVRGDTTNLHAHPKYVSVAVGRSLWSDKCLLAVRGLTFVEVADHEKAEWHTLYKEVLEFLSTNLNLKLPILALSHPEDVARSMTLGVGIYTLSP